GRWRNTPEAMLEHIADTVAHPVHERLGGSDEVADRGGIDGEEIREAHALDAHVGAWPPGKLVLQRLPTFAADLDPVQRPSHGVIAGGKDDDVQFVLGITGLEASGRDALDRGLAYVHQYDIVLVEHLIIPALTWEALGAEHMVFGHEFFRHHWI